MTKWHALTRDEALQQLVPLSLLERLFGSQRARVNHPARGLEVLTGEPTRSRLKRLLPAPALRAHEVQRQIGGYAEEPCPKSPSAVPLIGVGPDPQEDFLDEVVSGVLVPHRTQEMPADRFSVAQEQDVEGCWIAAAHGLQKVLVGLRHLRPLLYETPKEAESFISLLPER